MEKEECQICYGSGKRYHGPDDDAYTSCKKCNGTGVIQKMKKEDGFSECRFKNNPKEKAFAREWIKLNRVCHTLEYLLGDNNLRRKATPSETSVANTIIQWLGSPCGQAFIRDVDESMRKENQEDEG